MPVLFYMLELPPVKHLPKYMRNITIKSVQFQEKHNELDNSCQQYTDGRNLQCIVILRTLKHSLLIGKLKPNGITCQSVCRMKHHLYDRVVELIIYGALLKIFMKKRVCTEEFLPYEYSSSNISKIYKILRMIKLHLQTISIYRRFYAPLRKVSFCKVI